MADSPHRRQILESASPRITISDSNAIHDSCRLGWHDELAGLRSTNRASKRSSRTLCFARKPINMVNNMPVLARKRSRQQYKFTAFAVHLLRLASNGAVVEEFFALMMPGNLQCNYFSTLSIDALRASSSLAPMAASSSREVPCDDDHLVASARKL